MNVFYVFKVIRDNACFPFLRALIGLKKLAPLLHQSEVNWSQSHVGDTRFLALLSHAVIYKLSLAPYDIFLCSDWLI